MRAILVFFLILPGYAFAAGGGGGGNGADAPPKPTQTTKSCKGIKVWDPVRKRCVNPRGSSLDERLLYDAVRELAYAGRYLDAQGVLSTLPDQLGDEVLTYWGFTHRKLGNDEKAQKFYDLALATNPDNLLARSYRGQGMVADGNLDGAIDEWRQIVARGGEGSWPETSLREAIRTGLTHDY